MVVRPSTPARTNRTIPSRVPGRTLGAPQRTHTTSCADSTGRCRTAPGSMSMARPLVNSLEVRSMTRAPGMPTPGTGVSHLRGSMIAGSRADPRAVCPPASGPTAATMGVTPSGPAAGAGRRTGVVLAASSSAWVSAAVGVRVGRARGLLPRVGRASVRHRPPGARESAALRGGLSQRRGLSAPRHAPLRPPPSRRSAG